MRRLPASPHLLLFSLCLGLAAATALRLDWPVAAAGVAAVAAGVLVGERPRPWLLALGLCACGWGWGSARLEALDRSPLRAELGRTAPARVVVTGPARRSRYGFRVPARLQRFANRDISEPVLLRLPLGRSPPQQGAIVEATATATPPSPKHRGFDEGAWLRRHGVHVVLRARSWRPVGRRGGLGGVADRIRSWVAAGAAAGLEGERRAVVLGVVLGEDEGLSEELRSSFRASGLYHLLAVSGQNVALVAGGALLLAWVAGLSRLVGQLMALVAIAAYVLAVGGQPSVVRAGVAGGLACLAWICARERDRWWFLLLGAFCLLAWSPYNLLDPGFQLSFAAVAAIFVLVPRFLQKLEGYPLPPRLAPVVAVSAACGLATAPILLVQFGRVPVYSVAANALAAAAVPPLLGLALAASLLHPLAPGAAQLVAWLAGWCAAWLALVARLVAGLPHPQLDGQEALLAGVLTTGGLLAWRLRRRASRTALAAVLVSCLAFWAAWPLLAPTPSWSPPSGLRATFLDVGQGDATLLETAAGAVLVDEGPPTADVAGVLRRRGLRSLAALVLTHPQRDHIGGAEEVVRRLRVGMVVYPALAVSSPEERRVLAEARERGVAIEVARAGEEYRLGRLRLHVLWPQGPGSRKQDPNENAIVLRASYGATDLLLTADAESEVTARLPLAPVEVLKVAHHGSRDAGLPLLLQRLRPQVAVISVGRANDYGHPSPSTLAALAAVPGLRLYRTDQDGEVVLESDGAALALAAGR